MSSPTDRSTEYPPQQGYAWRGNWEQRLEHILAQRGFGSVTEFATAHPLKSFVELAAELGSGDVAGIQLEWKYLEEAKRTSTIEQCARDFLVRALHEFIGGWPRLDDLVARTKLGSALAAWSSSISVRLPDYSDTVTNMAVALLSDEDVPDGWMPAGVEDSTLADVFSRHWKESL